LFIINLQYIQPGKPAQREDVLDINLFDNLNEVKNITNLELSKEWDAYSYKILLLACPI